MYDYNSLPHTDFGHLYTISNRKAFENSTVESGDFAHPMISRTSVYFRFVNFFVPGVGILEVNQHFHELYNFWRYLAVKVYIWWVQVHFCVSSSSK